jgi:hypothetical protein
MVLSVKMPCATAFPTLLLLFAAAAAPASSPTIVPASQDTWEQTVSFTRVQASATIRLRLVPRMATVLPWTSAIVYSATPVPTASTAHAFQSATMTRKFAMAKVRALDWTCATARQAMRATRVSCPHAQAFATTRHWCAPPMEIALMSIGVSVLLVTLDQTASCLPAFQCQLKRLRCALAMVRALALTLVGVRTITRVATASTPSVMASRTPPMQYVIAEAHVLIHQLGVYVMIQRGTWARLANMPSALVSATPPL